MFFSRLLCGTVLVLFTWGRWAHADDEPFGISPADPSSVQRGIEEAGRQHAAKVVVPPGTYRLDCPAGQVIKMGAVQHLHFEDLSDLEIDAEGVTFVDTTRDVPSIRFFHCHRVTLKGATFVHEIPPFSQGRIEAIAADRMSADVRVDAGYPMDIEDDRYFGHHIPCLNVYDSQTGILKRGIGDIGVRAPTKLVPGLFRFPFISKHDEPLTAGDRVAWRGWGFADVVSDYCDQMHYVDVTLKACSMQGFADTMGSHDIYQNCTITYGPMPPGAVALPLLATNADGFFFTNSVAPTLDHCRAEGLDDDGIALRGSFAMGISSSGNKVICASHRIPLGPPGAGDFFHAGDHLHFYDRRGVLAGDAQVVSLRVVSGYQPDPSEKSISRAFADPSSLTYSEVTLDHAVPMGFDWRIADEEGLCNGFIIRDCIIRNGRNSGLRIKAGDGLIENCTIENILYYGIKLSPELRVFNEADYARNVTIRNNTLRNVGISGLTRAALMVGSDDYPQPPPLPGGHRNITLDHNTFWDQPGTDIVVTSAQGVSIRGNVFNLSSQGSSSPLIHLTQCSVVDLKDNIALGSGTVLHPPLSVDPTVGGTGLNDGLSFK